MFIDIFSDYRSIMLFDFFFAWYLNGNDSLLSSHIIIYSRVNNENKNINDQDEVYFSSSRRINSYSNDIYSFYLSHCLVKHVAVVVASFLTKYLLR